MCSSTDATTTSSLSRTSTSGVGFPATRQDYSIWTLQLRNCPSRKRRMIGPCETALFVPRNHSGRFTATRTANFETASNVAISDLNGDGDADLMASVRTRGKCGLVLFGGKGASTFRLSRWLEWENAPRKTSEGTQLVDVCGDGLKKGNQINGTYSSFGGSVWESKITPRQLNY